MKSSQKSVRRNRSSSRKPARRVVVKEVVENNRPRRSKARSTIGQVASTIGSNLAGMAGDWISKITGFGDYKVNSNSIIAGNSVPTFSPDGTGGMIVCHREFLGDIKGSTLFNVNSYSVNPGLQTSFPWLCEIAQNFEEYEMLGLVYEYRPTSGSAVATSSSALGVVVYATDYNVNNPPFETKQQMEAYEFAVSCVPFEKMLHPIECRPKSNLTNSLLVRGQPLLSTQNQQLYDLGIFQVATQGMQSAYIVGELWVSYHVRFNKPRIAFNPNTFYWHAVENPINTATAAAPLGTGAALVATASNLVGVSQATSGTGQILMQNIGNYLLTYSIVGGTFTNPPAVSYGANISNLAIQNNSSATAIASYTSTQGTMVATFTVTNPGATSANYVTLGGNTGAVGSASDVFIVQLPSAGS